MERFESAKNIEPRYTQNEMNVYSPTELSYFLKKLSTQQELLSN